MPVCLAAGRADIATGQKTLESKLDTLLQRQQAALDAALQATATLAAIQDLSQRQVSALSGLDAAVKEQVKSISVATQQGLISLATVRGPLGVGVCDGLEACRWCSSQAVNCS